MHVLGRRDDRRPDGHEQGRREQGGREPDSRWPVGRLGAYRARDGSPGETVGLDLGGPHAVLVVGKRGSGKTYTLGVLAEELARVDAIAPVVVDPMGTFGSLADADVPAAVEQPRVPASAFPSRAWPLLVGLDPEGAPGSLVWRAAVERDTLDGMRTFVADRRADRDLPAAAQLAAANHLDRAAEWDVFDHDPPALLGPAVTVLDCAGLEHAAMNAVCRAVAARLYRVRLDGETDRLPWLLLDEAHVFFDGVAGPALRRLFTRGRHPGVSLVAATQRPSALPSVAVSQADLVIAHRLSGTDDRDALQAARPAAVRESLANRSPAEPGDAVVVDDADERVHRIRVRERRTPHGGATPQIERRDGGPP